MWIHLLRHGIAIDRTDPACPTDPERYLTDKGRARTRAAAAGLGSLDLGIDLVVCSPYVRAQQTADLAIEGLGDPDLERVTTDALVPGAEPESLDEVLRNREANAVLCVGHAPNLDWVLAHLVGADEPVTQLKKAGCASIEIRATKVGHGCGRLFAVYPPSTLRRLGGQPRPTPAKSEPKNK